MNKSDYISMLVMWIIVSFIIFLIVNGMYGNSYFESTTGLGRMERLNNPIAYVSAIIIVALWLSTRVSRENKILYFVTTISLLLLGMIDLWVQPTFFGLCFGLSARASRTKNQ